MRDVRMDRERADEHEGAKKKGGDEGGEQRKAF